MQPWHSTKCCCFLAHVCIQYLLTCMFSAISDLSCYIVIIYKTLCERAWTCHLGYFAVSPQQPSPVFLPGEFHGQRRLAAYSPWGHKELNMTEQLTLTHENLLQYKGAWELPTRFWPRSLTCIWQSKNHTQLFQICFHLCAQVHLSVVGNRPVIYLNNISSYLLSTYCVLGTVLSCLRGLFLSKPVRHRYSFYLS